MFRSCYEGISQDKHLKQKWEIQRFRSMTKRVKLFCALKSGSFRSHWDLLFNKSPKRVPCSFIKSISFTVTVSLQIKVKASIACFYEPSPFVNKKTKTLALYHTVDEFSPTFSDFS